MKQSITGGLLALCMFIGITIPAPASALSCMDPAGMIDMYVEGGTFSVFTAVAGETTSFVQQAATDGDPNRQFDAGYVGQVVEVNAVHKGWLSDKFWVYHQQDPTWGYLCSSGPVEEGERAVFIVSNPSGQFDLTTVVNTYPTDSELATNLLAALAESDEQETNLFAHSAESRLSDLRHSIKEMIFLIRIKFAEWNFWKSQQ